MLLLFVVGRASEDYISAHKRTRSYSRELYKVLCEYISLADILVITPGIATEASNLARQFANPGKDEIQEELSKIISISEERHTNNIFTTEQKEYLWLGLCDTSTLYQTDSKLVLATDDFDLAKSWEAKGRDVLNFNYIREELGL